MQEPREIILVEYSDYVTKGSKRLLVTRRNKFVYIPILETIQQLLCNENVLSQVCIVGIIVHITAKRSSFIL